MGGYGFRREGNDSKLHTPRMPPPIYRYIHDKVHTALRQRFLIVASPIETPGKIDYGDLDVLVCWDILGNLNDFSNVQDIRKSLKQEELKELSHLVGATHVLIERKHNTTVQLAMPWPENFPGPIFETTKPPLAQIDLHICPSLEDLEWELFQYSHGDIFWFLHTMVRPFGLTLGVDGLQLRIKEIEDRTQDHGILLSKNPTKVLEFLGLPSAGPEWDRRFQSCEDLFEYAAKCRYFYDFSDDNISDADRKRMKSRKVYRAWVEEFVPKCRAQESFRKPAPSRDQVRKDVMTFFTGPCILRTSSTDKHLSLFSSVERAYYARILAFKKDQQVDLYSRVILPCVYQHVPKVHSINWLGNVGRAFEGIVMNDDQRYGILPETALRTEDGLYLEPDVRLFIRTS